MKSRFWTLFLAIFCFSLMNSASANPCDPMLDPAVYFRSVKGKIGYGVGGSARVYPLSFTLENLGLTEAKVASTKGKVLLLGEGYGTLLPLFLETSTAEVIAVDPIYALNPMPEGFMGEALVDYIAEYSSHLESSSSDRLSAKSNSINFIYSHMLVNNLVDVKLDSKGEPEIDKKGNTVYDFSKIAVGTIREAIRVLKPNGRAVFAGMMTKEESEQLMDLVMSDGNSPEEKSYSFEIESFQNTVDYKSFGSLAPDQQDAEPFTETFSRVIIKKKRNPPSR